MRLNRGMPLLLFLLLAAPVEAGLREGELNPDLTNPGWVEFPDWFKNSFLDIAEDIEEAKAEGRRLALFFYQDGCPYCEKLVNVNFAQHDIEQQTRETVDILAINMWGDREVTWLDGETMTEKAFARKMRVMFTPTLLFLDEEGKVALRVNGYYKPSKFKAALRYVAEHGEKRERFADYYNRLQPVPATGKLHADPFLRPLDRLASPPADGRYRLVLFEQKQCPNCDELHLDVFRRPETRELLDRLAVFQVDMWSKAPVTTPAGETLPVRDWARRLDIKYAPSMVFFDADGREVFRAEAYLKSFHVQSVLEYVSSGAFLRQPEFQRFVEERADRLRAEGKTVDLMK